MFFPGGCWRLVDVHWASLTVFGGTSSDWLLLDNNGHVIRDPLWRQTLEPASLVHKVNDSFFLMDSHQFIYR